MLTDIDTWVLDLDNTLYRADSALAAQLTHGILTTVATFYGTDVAGARRIQAELVAAHGTSLRGAMVRTTPSRHWGVSAWPAASTVSSTSSPAS